MNTKKKQETPPSFPEGWHEDESYPEQSELFDDPLEDENNDTSDTDNGNW